MKNKYIGLKLAKHLYGVGFEGECDAYYADISEVGRSKKYRLILPTEEINSFLQKSEELDYPAYTYYEIMIDYAKELFGSNGVYIGRFADFNESYSAQYLISMLQQNKPQEEIDNYIISNLAEKWQVKK